MKCCRVFLYFTVFSIMESDEEQKLVDFMVDARVDSMQDSSKQSSSIGLTLPSSEGGSRHGYEPLPDKFEERGQSPPPGKLMTMAGCLVALAGTASSVITFSCVQAMGDFVPGFELTLCRFVVQLLVVSLIVLVKNQDIRVPWGCIPFICIVAVFSTAGSYSFFEAAKHLSAGTVGCANPTLILGILSIVYSILAKRCRLYVVVGISVCIIGSMLYAQPEFMFGEDTSDRNMHPITCGKHHKDEHEAKEGRHTTPKPGVKNATTTTPYDGIHANNYTTTPYGHLKITTLPTVASAEENTTTDNISDNSSSDSIVVLKRARKGWSFYEITHESGNSLDTDLEIGYMFVAVNAVCFCILVLVTKAKLESVNPFVLSFWLGLTGIVISLVVMILWESPSFPWTADCLFFLSVFALVGGGSQMFHLWAISLLPPTVFAAFFALSTIFYCVVQYTLLTKVSPSKFNAWELIGASLVVLGNIVRLSYTVYEENIPRKITPSVDEEDRFEMNGAAAAAAVPDERLEMSQDVSSEVGKLETSQDAPSVAKSDMSGDSPGSGKLDMSEDSPDAEKSDMNEDVVNVDGDDDEQ